MAIFVEVSFFKSAAVNMFKFLILDKTRALIQVIRMSDVIHMHSFKLFFAVSENSSHLIIDFK